MMSAMAGDDDKRKSDREWRNAMLMAGFALAIPFTIGIPTYLGWYADKRYETAPLWFLVGLFLGLLTTAFDIYKLLKKFGSFK